MGKEGLLSLPFQSGPFTKKLHGISLNHDPTRLPRCFFTIINLPNYSLDKHLLGIPHSKHDDKSWRYSDE